MDYEYFVNVIDVAQDIKHSGPLIINYSFFYFSIFKRQRFGLPV